MATILLVIIITIITIARVSLLLLRFGLCLCDDFAPNAHTYTYYYYYRAHHTPTFIGPAIPKFGPSSKLSMDFRRAKSHVHILSLSAAASTLSTRAIAPMNVFVVVFCFVCEQ